MGAAIGEINTLLAGVPLAAADEVGGPGVEFDEDVVLLVAFHDGEAALEVFVGVEGFGAGEAVGGEGGIGEAGEGEGADLLAVDVVGEEVPVVINAGEVVGVDVAGLGVFCGEVAVIEFEGAAFLEGAGEEAEGVEVGVFGGEGAEGEGEKLTTNWLCLRAWFFGQWGLF